MIEQVQSEGDFVLRGWQDLELLRLHVDKNADEMIITSGEYKGMRIIAHMTEMRELRDWLTRRLEEPIP